MSGLKLKKEYGYNSRQNQKSLTVAPSGSLNNIPLEDQVNSISKELAGNIYADREHNKVYFTPKVSNTVF